MHKDYNHGLTDLLDRVSAGVPGAQDALFERVYTELHQMAKANWRSVPASDTLQPTALVHEMYARLFRDADPAWQNRRHFFSAAARAMHDILVEQARRHASKKRGGGLRRMPLTGDGPIDLSAQADEVMTLHEMLDALKREHPDAAQVVMLRVFGGLAHEEIAAVCECAEVTVRRRWAFAKAWMKSYLDPEIT